MDKFQYFRSQSFACMATEYLFDALQVQNFGQLIFMSSYKTKYEVTQSCKEYRIPLSGKIKNLSFNRYILNYLELL